MTKSEFHRRVKEVMRRFQKGLKPRPKPKVRRVRVREHWRKVPTR